MINEHNPDMDRQPEDMIQQPQHGHDPDIAYQLERTGVLSDVAIGIRIRDARKSLYMTQNDLARCLGVSTSYVSLLEKGIRPVTHTILLSLLHYLNVSYDYLVLGKYPADTGFVSAVCEASSYDERLKLEHLLEKCTKTEYEMCYRLCSAYLETTRNSEETVTGNGKKATTRKPKGN